MSYLSASAVVIHYEEALYQMYAPFTFTLSVSVLTVILPGEPGLAGFIEAKDVWK